MSSLLPSADHTRSNDVKPPADNATQIVQQPSIAPELVLTNSHGPGSQPQHAQQSDAGVKSEQAGPLTSALGAASHTGHSWDRRFRYVNQVTAATEQLGVSAKQVQSPARLASPGAQERQLLQKAARSVAHARFWLCYECMS